MNKSNCEKFNKSTNEKINIYKYMNKWMDMWKISMKSQWKRKYINIYEHIHKCISENSYY